MTMPRKQCEDCNGLGYIRGLMCEKCHGEGKVPR